MKSSLVEITEQYVVNYLKKNLPPGAIYHSIDHTQEVVDAVKTLCKEEKISAEDTECVLIAAWFHDIGFVEGTEDHKEHSVTETLEFLKDQELAMDKLEIIINCIRATIRPVNPQNILEEILCDANLFYLATTNFEENGKLLRAEWEFLHNKILSDVEWFQCNADFLKEHRYFTNFAYKSWDGMKASNVALTEKKLKNALQKEYEVSIKENNKLKINSKKEKEKNKNVEIAYSLVLKNHLKLSHQQAVKSYVFMVINTAILMVVLTQLLPQIMLGRDELLFPCTVMILSSLITLIYAVIYMMSNVTSTTFTKDKSEQKSINILSFENYEQMSLNDFEEKMNVLMEDKECLYHSLNKFLYFSGIQLAKKQKKLRTAYFLFVIGMVISSLAFMIKSI